MFMMLFTIFTFEKGKTIYKFKFPSPKDVLYTTFGVYLTSVFEKIMHMQFQQALSSHKNTTDIRKLYTKFVDTERVVLEMKIVSK